MRSRAVATDGGRLRRAVAPGDSFLFSAMLVTLLGTPTLVGQPVVLSDRSDCFPMEPVLVTEGDGLLAAWLDDREFRLRRLDTSGAARGRDLRFAPAALTGHPDMIPSAPAVAPSDGGVVLAWLDFAEDPPRAWTAHVDEDGGTSYRDLGPVDFFEARSAPPHRLQPLPGGGHLFFGRGFHDAVIFDDESSSRLDLDAGDEPLDVLRVGDEVWLASMAEFVTSPPTFSVGLQRLDLDGSLLADVASRGTYVGVGAVRLAVSASSEVTMAWSAGEQMLVQRFAADGTPLTAALDLGTPGDGFPTRVEVADDPTGNTLVAWQVADRPLDAGREVLARTLRADGRPSTGPVVVFPEGPEQDGYLGLAAASLSGGRSWVATSPTISIVVTPPPCGAPLPRLSMAPTAVGAPDALLLHDGRFAVGVTWSLAGGTGSGTAVAVPDNGTAGSFWFFDPANKEIEVKVLDGRSINGAWWVFAAGLSDVGYEILVEDLVTGAEQRYSNPAGEFGNFIDTSAFPDTPEVP